MCHLALLLVLWQYVCSGKVINVSLRQTPIAIAERVPCPSCRYSSPCSILKLNNVRSGIDIRQHKFKDAQMFYLSYNVLFIEITRVNKSS